MSNKPRTEIGFDEWEAKGKELFRENREDWEFICPSCGNVASITLAKKNWPQLRGQNWNPVSECVGRYVDKVGCNWVAYGLFSGPLFINKGMMKNIAAFDFSGKPFTGNENREGKK